MIKYFDLVDYQKLKRLKKSNQLLPEDNQKLRNYIGSILHHVKYNKKSDYILLLNKYLEKKISPYEFRLQFLAIDEQNFKKTEVFLEDAQKLKNLVLFNESEKFSKSMSDISALCIECDISLDDCKEMSESKFYFLVKNCSSDFLQERLVYRSYKYLIYAVGLVFYYLISLK